jgi:integrase/recombinase XerD
MTSTDPSVSPLRQRMIDDMRMRRLSPKTRANYLHVVREFARYLGRSPDTATVEDLRRYQLHLVDHGTSPRSLNAAITGLRFFFEIPDGQLKLPHLWSRKFPHPGSRTKWVFSSLSFCAQAFRRLP